MEGEAPTLRRGGRVRWAGSRLTRFKELVVAEPLVNLKLASITVNDSPGSAQSIIEVQESEGSNDEGIVFYFRWSEEGF